MQKSPYSKKCLAIGIILLFIGTSVIPSNAQYIEKPSLPVSRSQWLFVGGSGPGNYSKIQDAVNNASNGDTVFVFDDSSPYIENVIIDKSISLIGENRNSTVIDGNWIEKVINVTVDWVNISGFTIQNSGTGQYCAGIKIYSSYSTIFANTITNNDNGIKLYGNSNTISGNIITNNYISIDITGDHNTLSDNTITHNYFGIDFYYADHNTISDNTITNNGYGIFILGDHNIISGNTITNSNITGIFVYDCDSNIISGNTIINNNNGIHIKFDSKLNNIINNTITNNGYAGIDLLGDSNTATGNIVTNNNLFGIVNQGLWNTISDNIITNNEQSGICLSGENLTLSRNIITNNRYGIWGYGQPSDKIINNTISNNIITNNNYDGMYLFSSDSNNIIDNNISNNGNGIFLSYSNRNNITSNNISNNRQGVVISYSTNNTIFKNNFLYNLRDAFFKKYKENIWDRNYWDKSRLLPKLIFGRIGKSSLIPWFNIDWHPAQEPYDIGG